MPPPGTATAERLLAPLRERPRQSAVLCDIDGTLAPIVEDSAKASVPPPARRLLEELSERYALVACVSGRRTAKAREMVGLDSLLYIGNHGLERLEPGATEPATDPAIRPLAARVRAFAAEHLTPEREKLGITLEDKDAIWVFHYRGVPDEESAHAALEPVASGAEAAGLHPHWGRKVLEIRPTAAVDKGTAVAALLPGHGLAYAIYGGDDTTDVDAFRRLRALTDEGTLAGAVCVGVASPETPAGVVEEADLVVEGTEGFREILEILSR